VALGCRLLLLLLLLLPLLRVRMAVWLRARVVVAVRPSARRG